MVACTPRTTRASAARHLVVASLLLLALGAAPATPSPLTERSGSALELTCPYAGLDYCEDPYADLLLHPALQEAARPVRRCRPFGNDLIFNGLFELPTGWDPDIEAPADLAGTLVEGMGYQHLFDPDLFPRRPVEAVTLDETTRTTRGGASYRQRTLVLIDPVVGEIPALLLLPPHADGPVPGIVALPGHDETPAWFRDHRLATFLPEHGFAVLIVGFREYYDAMAESRTSLRLLCDGFSLIGLRAYEGLVALKYLQHTSATEGQPLGVLSHSGGSAAANLLAWMPVNPAAAHVTDMQAEYFNVDEPGVVDCETHPTLRRSSTAINDLFFAPRPVLQVPYGFASDWEQEREPDPSDAGAVELFLPFLRQHLQGAPDPEAVLDLRREPLVINDDAGLTLVEVPAGRVTAEGREVPVRSVLVGQDEITVDQFRQFAPDHEQAVEDPGHGDLDLEDTHLPALVSWEQAVAFCAWLSGETGRVVRLPTEVEWVHLARAGVSTRYPWGDDPRWAPRWLNGATPETADLLGREDLTGFPFSDGYPGLAPAGDLRPNRFGLRDTLGNVAEWVADAWTDEVRAVAPLGEAGSERVLRGGSWLDGPEAVSLDARRGAAPDRHHDRAGFRVVVEPAP